MFDIEAEIVEENAAYRQGFNNAFLLAEYEPDLLKDIIPSLNESNDYFDGFFSGKAQWEQEHDKSLTQQTTELEELDQIRNEANELDQDLELE